MSGANRFSLLLTVDSLTPDSRAILRLDWDWLTSEGPLSYGLHPEIWRGVVAVTVAACVSVCIWFRLVVESVGGRIDRRLYHKVSGGSASLAWAAAQRVATGCCERDSARESDQIAALSWVSGGVNREGEAIKSSNQVYLASERQAQHHLARS